MEIEKFQKNRERKKGKDIFYVDFKKEKGKDFENCPNYGKY